MDHPHERALFPVLLRPALAVSLALASFTFAGCSGPRTTVRDIVSSPSSYAGTEVRLKDVPVSHYFRLPESEKGVYEIGSEAKIWVVADPPTPQLGDTVNLTGTVADNFSLGDYPLGLVILEKNRRLVYDYPGPTSPPVPTHPPSPPQIERVPPEINLFTAPGTNPRAEEIRIGLRNEAAPYWLARVDKPWLKVSPVEGSLSAGNDRMMVEADVSQFPAGLYTATITLRMETVDRDMPVRVYVTNGLPGQKLDAAVEVGRGTAWDTGIRLAGPFGVSVGVLERSLSTGAYFYDQGDMAVFLQGVLANDSDSEWQVDFWPEAFDSAGNQVAWGLDRGGAPLMGHLQMNVAAHSSRQFTFHLTWAENVSRIVINANKYPAYPALP